MKRVHVKRIFTANFTRSPRTMYDEVRADRKLWRGPLQEGETYVFVSQTGNQLVFVLGDHEVTTRPGTRWATTRRLLDWRGWRIWRGEDIARVKAFREAYHSEPQRRLRRRAVTRVEFARGAAASMARFGQGCLGRPEASR